MYMHATAQNFDMTHDILLGKIGAGQPSSHSVGDITFLLNTAGNAGKIVGRLSTEKLTRFEYQIFWLLSRAPGALITRDEIMYFIYDEKEKDIPLFNTVEVFISRIRKKLQRVTDAVAIETFRGFGYRCVVA
jgi:DNA-binding response OmpR family regulator